MKILLALGVLALLAACLPLLERRLTYFPYRKLESSPAALGLACEEVYFQTADGLSLHGWFIPHRRARAVILLSHGNAGNISHRLEKAGIFHHLSCATFLYDYRGYGQSEGSPGEKGLLADGEAAYRWLTESKRVPPGEVLLYGESLGAAVAIHLAARKPAAALVAEGAFASFRRLAREAYPVLGWLARSRYDNLGTIPRVAIPKLIIHARDDEIVPPAHAPALYQAAPPPKKMLWLERGGHNEAFLLDGEAYRKGLEEFLAELGPREAANRP